MGSPAAGTSESVLTLADVGLAACADLLRPFHLTVQLLNAPGDIPGSYWGESEAGLIGNVVYCRADTPVHSLLHEACHYICMDARRRKMLERDAGGGHDEENAVCYLQILLASCLGRVGALRMTCDMDAWGYTFRLGSAQAWFEEDSGDTRVWLREQGLIDADGGVTWALRQD